MPPPPQKKKNKEGFLEKSGILPPRPLCSFLMVRPYLIENNFLLPELPEVPAGI